jgi:hypothetical protein
LAIKPLIISGPIPQPIGGGFFYLGVQLAELTPGTKTGNKMAGVAITHSLKSLTPAQTPSSQWARQT